MKVFSHIEGSLDGYIPEERLDGFVKELHFKYLGNADGLEFHSFDPEFVELSENDEKFQVRIYNPLVEEDKEILNNVKNKLWVVKQDLNDIKSKLKIDIFAALTGLATNDKYVIEILTEIKKEHDDYLINLGF